MEESAISVDDFAPEVEPIDMEKFTQKAEQAAIMKHKLALLKEETTSLKKEFDYLCAELCAMMLESNLDKASISGLSITPDFGNKYFKAKGVTEDVLFAWLQGNDLADIIKPTVHFKTLSSSVLMFVEQGGEIDTNVINESPYKNVSIRGLPKFLEEKGLS